MNMARLFTMALVCALLAGFAQATEESIHFREGGGSGYTDVEFDDAYLDKYYPSTIYGASSYLEVWTGAHRLYSVMAIKDLFTELPLTSGGADIEIVSATLNVTRYNSGSSSTEWSVCPMTTNWLPDDAGSNEDDCCWSYLDKSESTQWASGDFSTSDFDTTVCSTGYYVSNWQEVCHMDITDVIEEIYSDEVNYGWVLDADSNINMYSSENGSGPPSLEITYEYVSSGYALTVNSGSGSGTYAEAATPTITADAAPSGQDFDKWVGDTSGIASQTSSSTTLTMPASAQEVTATYKDKVWVLTVNSGTGDGSYVVGTIQDIDADTAPSGQDFSTWTGDTTGIASLTSASTTITMPYSDAEITATYADKTWTLTVNSGTGDGSYVVDAVVPISADSAPSGQQFDEWTGDTAEVSNVNASSTNLTMPYGAAEVTATYVDKQWILTVHSGSGGGSYVVATVVNIDADTPPAGKTFDEWVGDTDGIASVATASTTLTMPYADAEITATYADITYTLTVNSGTGDGSYTAGTSVGITADTPPNGTAFDEWTGDVSGITDVTDSSTNIVMPTSNAEITATYSTLYTLTVNSGSGDGDYQNGQVVDISADAASSGYLFDAWTGDTSGIADLNDGTTTLTMSAAATEVTATYTEVVADLVSRWTFDVDARDTYGANDGTLINEASVVDDASQGNKVLSLDGVDDQVDLTGGALAAGRSEVTLSMWVNADSWSGGRTLYDEENSWYWQFSITSDAWYTRDTSTGVNGTRDNDLALPTVPTGAWHHLAFRYSVTDGSKEIYYDGELYSSTTTSVDTLTSSRTTIAIGWPSDGSYYDGKIDDVRFYSRALTRNEIALLAGGVPLYTLTVNSGSGDGDYPETEVVNISADAAASGKQFEKWVGDTANLASATASSTTVTMPASAVEVTATYVSVYTLTVNSGTGDGVYEAATVVDVYADTPASGKQFDEWTGDTGDVASATSPNTTVTMPSSDVDITATYEDIPSGTTQLIVDWGDSEGNNVYDFSDWGDPYLGLYTSYSSLGPDGLKAGWTGTAMSGAVSGSSETFSEGDQIKVTWYNSGGSSLTIYPKISFDDPDGYGSGTSGTWYDLGELVCSSSSSGTTTYTFTSGTEGNYDLVNVCRYTTGDYQPMMIDKVELVTEGGGGTTYALTVNSGTGSGTYAPNSIVDITADAAPSGKQFDQWTGDISGIASVTSSSTTITMPASNAEITATYTDIKYTLTVNSGTGDGSYASGVVVDISADAAASGEAFKKWTGQTGNVADTLDATTTITMPSANTEITATYVNVYTLTVNNGTGDGTYEESTIVDIAADAAASGEVFDEWTGDTTDIADVTDSTTTITMSASDSEVTATYVNAYTLTVNSGTGDGVYEADTVVEIVADAPPADTQFDQWVGDTANIADVNAPTTTITMPSADAEITATYENIYTLTVTNGTGDGSYTQGTVVNIQADSPASGQTFDEWIGDTANIADVEAATTTITIPASDADITATYRSLGGGYTLTVNSGTGDGNYNPGTSVDISADAAASGYLFDKWTGDVANVTDVNDPTTTFVMPSSDAEITAAYTEVVSGLVSRYTFDIDGRDSYGTNDGTLTGAAVVSDATRGNVLSLDGTDDYMSLPSANMAAGRSELTLVMWVKPDEWVSGNTIWDEYSGSYWQFSVTESTWYTRDSSTGTTGTRNNDLSMPTISSGSWHHLAFVYSVSGSKKELYYDGALHTSSSTSVDALTSDRDAVRMGYPCDGTYYDGMIDDVRLYNRALSINEIAILADQTTYTLTVNSGTGDGDYVAGAIADISADAAPSGQDFDDWVGDTSNIASVSSSSTTLTMPAANQEITATYSAASSYGLTVNSGSGSGTYLQGTVVNISANSPASGKTFDVWIGDTSTIDNVNSASTTITMPSSNVEVTATYADVGSGPAISSTSGTWSDGNSVTISGSGFGTKSTAAPAIWDDFDGGTNGNSIAGQSPVVGPSWDTYTSHGTNPRYSNTGNRTNSTLCSLHDFVVSSQYNCSLEYISVESQVFFTFWWKYTKQQSYYNRNTKPWVEYGQGGGMWPSAYIGFGNPDYGDGSLRNSVQDQPHPTDGTLWGATNLTSVASDWIRIDQYLEQSSPNVSNGTFKTWVHKPYSGGGITFDCDSGENVYMTRTSSNNWRQWHFGSFFSRDTEPAGGGLPADGYIYIDDIYFDVTRARVEVGNASTWSGCSQREIQRPTAWSSSSVTVVANEGGFSSLSGKYVYVVDSEGNVNANGYAIP